MEYKEQQWGKKGRNANGNVCVRVMEETSCGTDQFGSILCRETVLIIHTYYLADGNCGEIKEKIRHNLNI